MVVLPAPADALSPLCLAQVAAVRAPGGHTIALAELGGGEGEGEGGGEVASGGGP